MEYIDLTEQAIVAITDYCGWLSPRNFDNVENYQKYVHDNKNEIRNYSLFVPYIISKSLQCCVTLDKESETLSYDINKLMPNLIRTKYY